jgi:M6 family metalloprotease-like protein
MKHFKKSFVISMIALAAVAVLSSCGFNSVTYYDYLDATASLTKEGTTALSYYDLDKQNAKYVQRALPSSGDIKLLCLPVEFTDYPFAASTLTDLGTLFNGTASDTGYWESLSSFYEKSSFGKAKISVTIASAYDMGMTADEFLDAKTSSRRSTDALKEAIAAYKSKTGDDCASFDSDQDGYIDGVYLVYSCPDYQRAKEWNSSYFVNYTGTAAVLSDNFWAYTTWASGTPDVLSPVPNAYSWISYDFMYAAVATPEVDAHTFIHETGHLFGLDDYYNYDTPSITDDTSTTGDDYKYYSPTGALDMMDYNILDHDMWSKYALGWASPYVISASLSFPLTIEINEAETSGDFILIPDASSTFNGTAFGEYLMVELYAPDHLNELDSGEGANASYGYLDAYPRGFFIPGIKITHIDSRLINVKNGSTFSFVDTVTSAELAASSSSSYYDVGASNTPSQSAANKGFRLIHLLEANGVNTLQNADRPLIKKTYFADNGTLFQGDSDRGDFNMAKFSSFFENQDAADKTALFNDGKDFGYSLKINGIQEKSDGTYWSSLTIRRV